MNIPHTTYPIHPPRELFYKQETSSLLIKISKVVAKSLLTVALLPPIAIGAFQLLRPSVIDSPKDYLIFRIAKVATIIWPFFTGVSVIWSGWSRTEKVASNDIHKIRINRLTKSELENLVAKPNKVQELSSKQLHSIFEKKNKILIKKVITSLSQKQRNAYVLSLNKYNTPDLPFFVLYEMYSSLQTESQKQKFLLSCALEIQLKLLAKTKEKPFVEQEKINEILDLYLSDTSAGNEYKITIINHLSEEQIEGYLQEQNMYYSSLKGKSTKFIEALFLRMNNHHSWEIFFSEVSSTNLDILAKSHPEKMVEVLNYVKEKDFLKAVKKISITYVKNIYPSLSTDRKLCYIGSGLKKYVDYSWILQSLPETQIANLGCNHVFKLYRTFLKNIDKIPFIRGEVIGSLGNQYGIDPELFELLTSTQVQSIDLEKVKFTSDSCLYSSSNLDNSFSDPNIWYLSLSHDGKKNLLFFDNNKIKTFHNKLMIYNQSDFKHFVKKEILPPRRYNEIFPDPTPFGSYTSSSCFDDVFSRCRIKTKLDKAYESFNKALIAINVQPRVSSKSSDKEIKKAYRDLILKYHPDKYKRGDEEFKRIQAAWEEIRTSRGI